MIKMILAIGHINYDKFLNNMLEIAKQHPEQMLSLIHIYIKTLRKKLGEAGSMIKTVRNVGYIMSDKEN